MRDRRWTVLLVPHGSEGSKSFSLSERSVRAAGRVVGALALAVLIGGVAAREPRPSVAELARENLALRHELSDLHQQLAGVEDTLTTLAQRDKQLRLLAGLPLSASFAELSGVLARNVERLAATPSIMPTAGWLTSNFSRSRFHPLLHESRPHEGIDVSASMGAPIVAPAVGVVTRAETDAAYGLLVEIDHGNGIVTKYAHCSRITVQPGQRVTRGEIIATVGNSGLSSGPHLHYEIRVNGLVVDPLTYVMP